MVRQTITGGMTNTLEVPGGRLYYEVRGSGPVLLVIGQPMTSEPFAPVADLLADQYTVVTYDPRGLGNSAVDDPTRDVTPEVEGDDLAALIDAVGGGAAEVFGTSGGAVAGLALLAQHPDRVHHLIAHEPPVTELLPDAQAVRAAVDDVQDAYRDNGSGAAWGKFMSLVVHSGEVPDSGVPFVSWPPREADESRNEDVVQNPDPPAHVAGTGDSSGDQDADEANRDKQTSHDELFFLHMLKPFTRYEPPVELLRARAPRIVVAVGESSGGEIARRSAVALAERLGSSPVTFPGDHGGFMGDPGGFAEAIRRALTAVSDARR